MEIDPRGSVVRYELHDGVIHSNARMTYTEVNAILTDRDPATIAQYRDLVPMFERMRELFEILNRRRRRRGSIDFDLKEPEIVLDDEGMVEEIIAARAQRRPPADRGVHAASPTKPSPRISTSTTCRRCTASTKNRIR